LRWGGYVKLISVILGLWLSAALAAQEPPAVPFHLVEGWAIVVDGTIGGIPNRKIMIDTGAVPSAVNSKFVKQLGLVGSLQKISAMNRSIDAKRLRVPDVRIGPLSAEALEMMAVDLEGIEQRLDTHIDAVIGLDFLAQRNFHIDYRHRKLAFDNKNGVGGVGAITVEIRHEAGGTYLIIPLQTAGHQFQVLLDTGTRDLTLFDRRVGSILHGLRILGKDLNVTAGGQNSLVAVEMDSIKVGPIFLRNQKAYVLSASEEDSRDFDGVLGPAALDVSDVAFDFDRHTVSFEPR
jgi:predicted aspartyl protease